ncbi:MAG: hypoxanthine phosphoribosyltransferase [Candidatus Neomarinimicrobiota bacterium]|nr:hypoxanthine phosphoribosyltransferase [Candidatus Neomarinimicrobiota bacterium]MEC9437445.1 hypoxanthine phosphoribosyltransferase [Candidatus Neomarinimicrobiota bacterium]
MTDSTNLKELISKEELASRVLQIASEISENYKTEPVLFIIVLNGSFIFASDLIRAMEIDCEVDFIKVASYTGDQSTGKIKFEKDLSSDISGKNVIIIEDIIDSGITINFLKQLIENKNPKSLKIATLLLKPEVAKLNFEIDWVGFEISPEFVVGYGLDYNQKLRNLNAVYRLGGVN